MAISHFLTFMGCSWSRDGMPVRINDDEVKEEVAGEVSRKPKVRNNVSTHIKFKDVDDEVEAAI